MAKRQITRNDDDDGDDDDDYDDDVDDHDDDSYSHHVSIFCSAMKLLNEGANPNCVVFLRLMCAAMCAPTGIEFDLISDYCASKVAQSLSCKLPSFFPYNNVIIILQ